MGKRKIKKLPDMLNKGRKFSKSSVVAHETYYPPDDFTRDENYKQNKVRSGIYTRY